MSEPFRDAVLWGAFGAAFQELLYWWRLRGKLGLKSSRKLLASKGYWTIVVVFTVASGLGTYAWFEGQTQSVRTYVVVGAFFPLLLKLAKSAFEPDEGPNLGRSTWSSYFR